MKREEREVYMSLKVSDIDIKIEKAEKEMAHRGIVEDGAESAL